MKAEIALIAAVAEGGVIGRAGDLPWKLPRDLGNFKRRTRGHPLVMGRLTWESIGVPLPGRTMIVVSKRETLDLPDGIQRAASLEAALELAAKVDDERIFIGGGAAIYRDALPVADRLFLTRVFAAVDGEVRVPELEEAKLRDAFKKVSEEPYAADDRHAYGFAFEEWVRRPA